MRVGLAVALPGQTKAEDVAEKMRLLYLNTGRESMPRPRDRRREALNQTILVVLQLLAVLAMPEKPVIPG